MDERKAKAKELAMAFQGVSNTPDGKIMIEEISKMCNENEPTHVDQNPTGSAYKEGQRSIILGIRKQINKTFEDRQERAEL